jgi:hypothetical protein
MIRQHVVRQLLHTFKMTTKCWLLVTAGVLAIAYDLGVANAQDTLLVNSDSVHLKFENSRVRVLESRLAPGGREKMHSHRGTSCTLSRTV